jgi:hypothetical protein
MPEDLVEYTPPKFQWTKDHWKKVREAAMDLGLITKGVAGEGEFGDLLATALEKFDAFRKAVDEKSDTKKRATYEPARAAITSAKAAAEGLRDTTKHTNLRKYFADGVKFAEGMEEYLKRM